MFFDNFEVSANLEWLVFSSPKFVPVPLDRYLVGHHVLYVYYNSRATATTTKFMHTKQYINVSPVL